jgi:hypothetical protein|tara:strand:+ start:744 stop:920 length:177 start_codon:yes stop_codon:yes gene_type:complete
MAVVSCAASSLKMTRTLSLAAFGVEASSRDPIDLEVVVAAFFRECAILGQAGRALVAL